MSSPPQNGPEKVPTRHDDKITGGVVQQQQPSSEDSEVSDAAGVAEENSQNLTPGLPFSKARCIALVATLTGASFLGVSHPPKLPHS
jgi:hypothetical protein